MSEDASKAINAKADVAQRWGGRVPIILGATGHRKIKPEARKIDRRPQKGMRQAEEALSLVALRRSVSSRRRR